MPDITSVETNYLSKSQLTLTEQTKNVVLLGKPRQNIVGDPEFRTILPDIKDQFNKSWVWHGTGRFQYDVNNQGQVRDVLEMIVQESGLIPHRDVLDFTQGEMQSVSTSPAWLYSLMYSQYHFEKGRSFFNPLINTMIWSYYLAPAYYRTLSEILRKNPNYTSILDREIRALFKKSAAGFHNKASREKVGYSDMLKGGASDIAGNYPIEWAIELAKQLPVKQLLDGNRKS